MSNLRSITLIPFIFILTIYTTQAKSTQEEPTDTIAKYTVQLGAFSTEKRPDEFKVTSIIAYRENGLWKYSTGRFNTPEEATGYMAELQSQNLINRAYVTTLPEMLISNKTIKKKPTPMPVPVAENSDIDDDNIEIEALTYQLVLGVFDESVPQEIANVIIRHSKTIIVDKDQKTTYKTHGVNCLSRVLLQRDYYMSLGVVSARIVANFHGVEMTLEEAALIRINKTLKPIVIHGTHVGPQPIVKTIKHHRHNPKSIVNC